MKILKAFAPRQRPNLATDLLDLIGLVVTIAGGWFLLAFAAALIHG